ncbi:MAG: UDP-4-amino-4,6-dideoxy-N-acetyl-beta-L-altrosamine transaminase [Gammaproteobacteria bacterium]|nr:UDP-4-amino-4,6-dideoxy-N-acetyl-beta-L-altrosamine transaminase [Gammaproteobacteria bacterium]
MIPYGRQDISAADIAAVVEVLQSDWITQGEMVPRFEAAVAAYCGAKHAVAVNSATSALHIACLALGVGAGDWVWTSPNTFVASANAALYCGAQVDFVDIDDKSYNLSVAALEEKLRRADAEGRLPKVVIPVHFAGQSCEMAAIHRLAQQYGFRIIEDASHAIGGCYQQQQIGGGQYSDITIFSFHPVKIITTGEGGMALTNSAAIANLMQRYRSHGITSDRAEMASRPEDEIWNYQQIRLGFNYRMNDFQAALGLSQLQRIDAFVARRREIAARYENEFADLPIITPWQHQDSASSYHLYPVRVRESRCGINQKTFYARMLQQALLVNLHYIPVYLQPYYQKMGFQPGYCPVSEGYYRETMSLPIYPRLTEDEQSQVITAVREMMPNSLC